MYSHLEVIIMNKYNCFSFLTFSVFEWGFFFWPYFGVPSRSFSITYLTRKINIICNYEHFSVIAHPNVIYNNKTVNRLVIDNNWIQKPKYP